MSPALDTKTARWWARLAACMPEVTQELLRALDARRDLRELVVVVLSATEECVRVLDRGAAAELCLMFRDVHGSHAIPDAMLQELRSPAATDHARILALIEDRVGLLRLPLLTLRGALTTEREVSP